MLPSPCTSEHSHPMKPVTKPTTFTTPSTDETYPETDPSTIATSGENVTTSDEEIESRRKPAKPISNILDQKMLEPQAKKLKTIAKNKGLRAHPNRILLRQLHLGNKHGKKAYSYRQIGIGPNLCLVECRPQAPEYQNNVVHQMSSLQEVPYEGQYVKVENNPVEMPIRPVWPQNVIFADGNGPFGYGDFMGVDDIGGDGEVATDPFMFEEKKMEKSGTKSKHFRRNKAQI